MDALARLVPALGVIVGSLFLIRWYLQKGRVGAQNAIKVVARAGLSKSASVAVVEVGGQRFLVGTTDQSVQLLAELDETEDAEQAAASHLRAVAGGTDASRPATQPTALSGQLTQLTGGTPTDRPRTGLIERLQRATLRRPSETTATWKAIRDRAQ